MGGCCLVVLASWISPRLAVFFLWLFTDRMSVAFDSFVAELLGFLVLPWTTLMYVLVYSPATKVSWFGWVIVAMGLMLDLGTWFGGGNKGREYYYAEYRA